MIGRVNMRMVLCTLCAAVLLITVFWSQCALVTKAPGAVLTNEISERSSVLNEEIECWINGEYSLPCKRDSDDVYLPFSFIHKYFEVYGKITPSNGVDRFEWSHSYSKVYHPKKKYDPRGVFVTFENYNVEVRERVKCISGVEEVPISIQWDPKGFFYPTQIAQFGLAHYSKNLTESEPNINDIEDGDKIKSDWTVTNEASMIREFDPETLSYVLKFSTAKQSSSQVWITLDISQDFVLGLDLYLKPNSTVTVVLLNKDKKETVYLHYVASSILIDAQDDHIYYGIGVEQKWRHVTRDLIVDMQKGWALQDKPKRKSPRNKFKISSLILTGVGSIDNVTLSTTAHMKMVTSAARWLVTNQHVRSGGWPVQVKRRIAAGVAELKPGWHSAMSQGHAISLLARAYHRSGDMKYLEAAKRALYILDVDSKAGGVRAMWMDKHVWYEEYPTNPPLFVLNGFIYTLLGLYDLHVMEGENSISLAKKMFDDGMVSLKTLLPLFDTGSGSFYDLRHFTLGVSPNIARWDYHATHVNQLYLLAGLDSDPIFLNTAQRWEGYMRGKRAAHN